MSLMEHLTEAARHLKEAARLAEEPQVKDRVGNVGTIVNCAIHVLAKVPREKLKAENTKAES